MVVYQCISFRKVSHFIFSFRAWYFISCFKIFVYISFRVSCCSLEASYFRLSFYFCLPVLLLRSFVSLVSYFNFTASFLISPSLTFTPRFSLSLSFRAPCFSFRASFCSFRAHVYFLFASVYPFQLFFPLYVAVCFSLFHFTKGWFIYVSVYLFNFINCSFLHVTASFFSYHHVSVSHFPLYPCVSNLCIPNFKTHPGDSEFHIASHYSQTFFGGGAIQRSVSPSGNTVRSFTVRSFTAPIFWLKW